MEHPQPLGCASRLGWARFVGKWQGAKDTKDFKLTHADTHSRVCHGKRAKSA
jgi:hypothetical protein